MYHTLHSLGRHCLILGNLSTHVMSLNRDTSQEKHSKVLAGNRWDCWPATCDIKSILDNITTSLCRVTFPEILNLNHLIEDVSATGTQTIQENHPAAAAAAAASVRCDAANTEQSDEGDKIVPGNKLPSSPHLRNASYRDSNVSLFHRRR